MHHRIWVVLSCCCLALTANASQLIVNGGFETGDFTGWTTASSIGSGGAWAVCPNADLCPAPPNISPDGYPTAGPDTGTYYAVSYTFGPGTNVLYQSITDPLGTTSAILSFSMFVNDQFGDSGVGMAELFAANVDPLTGTPITTLYAADTIVMNGNPNPYVPYTGDIASFMTPGDSYYLEFYESDFGGPVNVGVDSVSLVTSAGAVAPEPRMFLPAALLAALFASRSRRRFTRP